jgi:uncharacterized membrane protein YtjA (UPF0391 family)
MINRSQTTGSHGATANSVDLPGRLAMLRWALMFLVIALVAALLGFTSVAGVAYDAGKLVFVVFLVLAVVALFAGRRSTGDVV